MKYTVEIKNKDSHIPDLTEKEAIEQAKLYAEDGDEVFITWFRESDGQHGYLNRDGHGITGQAWTAENDDNQDQSSGLRM